MTTINGINTTLPIPIASGGTASTTAAGARTNLGLAIGTNVEAWSAGLDNLATVAAGATAGLLSQNGANTFVPRTLTGGTGVSIANGNGASGNPTLSLSANTANTLQGFDGSGNPVSVTAGSNITISGGVISSAVTSAATAQTNTLQAGDFGLNPWQKGTIFSALTGSLTNFLTADRWTVTSISIDPCVFTVSKSALAPTAVQAGFLTTASIGVTVQSAAAAAGSDVCLLSQNLEGYQWAQLAQQSTTLSFWVYATLTGTYSVQLINTATDTSYLAAYTISSSNTWEFKTINFTASPSAGTWNYGAGPALKMNFTLAAGSAQIGAPAAWGLGRAPGATGQVNVFSNTANHFNLALVKWEPGSSFTGWFPEKFTNVLAQSQRFYYKTFAQGTDPAQSVGTSGVVNWSQITAASTTQNGAYFPFPTTMYINSPTVTFYNPVSSNAQPFDITTSVDCSSVASYQISSQGMGITYTNAVGSAVGNIIGVHVTVDNTI